MRLLYIVETLAVYNSYKEWMAVHIGFPLLVLVGLAYLYSLFKKKLKAKKDEGEEQNKPEDNSVDTLPK